MAEQGGDDTEKTEEPTQKKLDDAHKKGDVPKSQEVNTWFIMVGAAILVTMFSGDLFASISDTLKGYLANAHAIPADAEHLRELVRISGGAVLMALVAPISVLVLAALAGNLVQHAPVFSTEQLKPKLSKISPVSGFKRLFSSTSLVNFAKGVAKLVIVGTVMFIIVWPERDRLGLLISADPAVLLPTLKWMATKMMIGVVAVLAVIAVADLMFQRWKWHEKQRMSQKEIRDEYKQLEGDPAVKAKLRQLRIERGRKRMMANVPRASVIITNPTHFAVALEYEPGMAAPVCVAKGIDTIALKIREIGKAHHIPIVENPPLARTLHETVEVDQEVPPQHYRAVAKVIGYVMKLREKRTFRRPADASGAT